MNNLSHPASPFASKRLLQPEDDPGILWANPEAPKLMIPVSAVKVPAGFPSHAQDYEEMRLDINDYLVPHLVSTFFLVVSGVSLTGIGIHDQDIVVVDRSIKPHHGYVVVAHVDGERLVKILYHRNERTALESAHPDYPTMEIQDGMELVIWGGVGGTISPAVHEGRQSIGDGSPAGHGGDFCPR